MLSGEVGFFFIFETWVFSYFLLHFLFLQAFMFKKSSEKTRNSILTSNFKLVLGFNYKCLGALKEGFVGDWEKVFLGLEIRFFGV